MRVISGTARGTKIFSPVNGEVRPTSDRIKETVFNIIQFDVSGSTFLDLFSGSGAMGIEALSRGARSAVFVESSKETAILIKDNLEKTKLIKKAKIVNDDVGFFLSNTKETFDIIFLDPPYAKDLLEYALRKIAEEGILKNNGLIIVEQDAKINVFEIDKLSIYKIKKYAKTKVVFYKWEV